MNKRLSVAFIVIHIVLFPLISVALEPDYTSLSPIATVGINGKFIAFSSDRTSGKSFKHVFNLGSMNLDDERLATLSFRNIETSADEYSLTFGLVTNNRSKLELRQLGKIVHEVDWSNLPGEKHNVYGFLKNSMWVTAGSNGVIEIYNTRGERHSELKGHRGAITALAYNDKWFVSGDDEGLISLWNLEEVIKGKKIIHPYLSMVFSKQNEWVIWSDDGIFSASTAGHKLLTINDKKSILDGSVSIYRDPKLLSKKISNVLQYQKLISEKTGNSKGIFNPPVVTILNHPKDSDKRDHELQFKVCDAGGGVQSVIVYLRGTPITIDEATRGLSVREKNKPVDTTDCNVYSRVVSLNDGENTIVITANNFFGNEANPAKTSIGYVAESKKKPRLHVAAVAVTQYAESKFDLKFPVEDAKALLQVFTDIGSTQFDSVFTYSLYDKNATKAGVIKFINQLSPKIHSDDVFVFFMAGHGQFTDNEYYYMPYDLNSNKITLSAISTAELMQSLSDLNASQTLLLIDTCQSGGFNGFVKEGQQVKTSQLRIAHRLGRASIMASSKEQAAFEGVRGHGAFTSVLLDALSGKADFTKDLLITVDELSVYVSKFLPDITERKWGYRQEAVRNTTGHDFVLGGVIQ